jgi:hypothetical protein
VLWDALFLLVLVFSFVNKHEMQSRVKVMTSKLCDAYSDYKLLL